jgi:UDP-4-amino-4,6-dideoxy-N-acetyl-beta-L-altrosamine transaminase
MKFIPYSCQDIEPEDVEAVCNALRSKFLTQGPTIAAFERAFAERHQVPHAVAVSNATAGLHIACLALGVGPGSRVWTSPNSFVASANCALYCGADIDFVDIDPVTRNMSVEALEAKLKRARSAGALPHAVIPVDFAGLACDLKAIRELADAYGFRLLEDSSHATGASYLGCPVGSAFAHAAVFSFHAVKIVTTAEGGIITTRDERLAHQLRLLRSHGVTREPVELEHAAEGAWYYEQQLLGFNYRMTDLQAALGLSQLARLDVMQSRREELARRYDQLLADLPIVRPPRLHDRRSSWHLYAIEIDETRTSKTRAEIYRSLRAAGIGVNVHYIPIHMQPFYSRRGFRRGDFPVSEHYYGRTISIPLFPALTDAQQDFVVQRLSDAFS